MFTSVSNRSAAAYKRVDAETSVDAANPHKLVSLLFGALQQALASARIAMVAGDVQAKCKHISHAVRILEEGLIAPLDFENGGELAANLGALYDYCVRQLTLSNLRNDMALLDEVGELLADVASGWAQIGAQGPAYLQSV
nr:flagellar export chaperone FliS [uncultured Rhodoferax sp.]